MSNRKKLVIGMLATLGMGAAIVNTATASTMRRASCQGLPIDGAHASFFGGYAAHVEGLARVERSIRIGKSELSRTAGIRMEMRPMVGQSAAYVQRLLECRLGQELASLGESVPAHHVRVTEGRGHFVIEVTAVELNDGKRLEALLRRALSERVSYRL